MAKIVIEIEDMGTDKVSVKASPNFEQIAKHEEAGNKLTPAHGYAIALLNRARQISMSNEPTNIIKIPKVRGTSL